MKLCGKEKYLAPEDPIYLNLMEWVDVRTYDVIKRRTDTSSYMYVSMQISDTENKLKYRTDSRHHGQGEEENIAKSEVRALLTVETQKTFYCCIDSS